MEGVQQRRGCFGRAGQEQAPGRLGIEQGGPTGVGFLCGGTLQSRAGAGPVRRIEGTEHARAGQFAEPGQDGDRVELQSSTAAGCVQHFEQVPGESEAGDVGGRADGPLATDAGCGGIRLEHVGEGRVDGVGGGEVLGQAGEDCAGAKRFGEDQLVTGLEQ